MLAYKPQEKVRNMSVLRVIMAVIWWTFARYGGTRFSRVIMPLKAWNQTTDTW